MTRLMLFAAAAGLTACLFGCASAPQVSEWEKANPIVPLPAVPLGVDKSFSDLPPADQPTPQRVRLGRWLFFDKRLSADGTIACSTCHKPDKGFSETEPHSTGVKGQEGKRKSPSFVNAAWAIYPNFFWDGRANSLEQQALGPVENPVEMGNSHEAMVQTLAKIGGYAPYFLDAFGTSEITKERVAKAIADYERTVMSGNSPWDRWKMNRDESAVSADVKLGDELFFGKAACNQCHLGQSLTDSTFHNVGIGWDPATKTFADEGRYVVTKKDEDRGAFKTPPLRDAALHAPYMHDGSIASLRQAVEHYNKGGNVNPTLDPKMKKLNLTEPEVTALVKFMEALTGEGPKYTAPASFPQ